MAKKKTELVKVEETSKELTRPAQKQTKALAKPAGTKIAGRGFENLEREDILLPRLKLLQSVSPEVMEQDLKAGVIFLNLQNKSLGEKIVITPVLHYKSRIKFVPLDDGGGIDCSAPNAITPRDSKYATACAECKFSQWDEKAEKKKDQRPACTIFQNFVVLVGDSLEPVILSMSSTKLKVARKWWSGMAMKPPSGRTFTNDDGQKEKFPKCMFDWQYELSSVKEKGDETTYYNYSVKDLYKKTSDKQWDACNELWEQLSDATITTQQDNEAEEGKTAEAAILGKY